jgi:hypothetical protein
MLNEFQIRLFWLLGIRSIGLERERSKGEGPTRRPAGIRTFALVRLLGALAVRLGGVALLATTTAAMAALAPYRIFAVTTMLPA